MLERAIDVVANGARLVGTLCLPSERSAFPVVLMVHGSGPLDRDQNMKGQKLDVFNTIAQRLAQVGVGSVRYDKRGCGASQGDYYAAGYHQLVEDVVCWFDLLESAEHTRAEQVFLLGHSEGCLVAAQASLHRPAVAALMLLCPFVEPTEDILMHQAAQIERELEAKTGFAGLVVGLVTRLMGSPVANQRALIGKLRASTEPSLRVGLQRLPAKCLRELLSVDAQQVYAATRCPMLLIGGDKDLQCNPADVSRIASLAVGPVESHVIANLTHLLRRDDQAPTILGAARVLAQPVDAELLELVAQWASSHSGG
ncbi:MAG TPA: alpha/beta fold hydrolase [Polyangiaceae bacterium]|nr:alpha/beta fold hydrolase [Polyangiaceae bacterium]